MLDLPAQRDTALETSGVEPPLCIDLDGTLLASDLLFECVAALVRTRPLLVFLLPYWYAKGRGYLKSKLASTVLLEVTNLPYNRTLLSWLSIEYLRGRKLVLATAAAQPLAQSISAHLGIFQVVIASSEGINTKGVVKLKEIAQLLGETFDYVGDSPADLPLFSASRNAIWVRSSLLPKRLAKTIGKKTECRFYPVNENVIRSWIREFRIHQWAKNVLIFVPLIAAHQVTNIHLLAKAFLCFIAFNLVASSVYVVNDILDLEADRAHSRKRMRPLASGSVSLAAAFCWAPTLFLAGMSLAFALNPETAVVVGVYYAVSLFYSTAIKKLVVYDVLTLGLLYTFRLFAGQEAYGIPLSTWLVSCCFFLFQSLAFCKRTSELRMLNGEENEQLNRRDYRKSDLAVVSNLGIGSGLIASLISVLYVQSENVTRLYHRPEVLWLLAPLILQWVARTWILAHRGLITGDPVLFSLKDRATWITAALAMGLMAVASF